MALRARRQWTSAGKAPFRDPETHIFLDEELITDSAMYYLLSSSHGFPNPFMDCLAAPLLFIHFGIECIIPVDKETIMWVCIRDTQENGNNIKT